VFLELGQFRSIGDQPQVISFKIGIRKMFHAAIVREVSRNISHLFRGGFLAFPPEGGRSSLPRLGHTMEQVWSTEATGVGREISLSEGAPVEAAAKSCC
jgi:hypothetical protein